MSPKKPPPSFRTPSSQSKCCGVVEEAAYNARAKRAARTKAQPWIVLKLMVFLTIAIIGYSAYVFVGRLCVNLIRNRGGRKRGSGIGLLVGFSILFLWMAWAYMKVIFTPPGFATEYERKISRPLFPEPPPRPNSFPDAIERDHTTGGAVDHDSIGGPSYENLPPVAAFREREQPVDTGNARIGVHSSNQNDTFTNGRDGRGIVDDNVGDNNVDVRPSRGATAGEKSLPNHDAQTRSQRQHPIDSIQRKPPSIPILRPEHRYCSIDEILKPFRTHHCRACGTCVLKYDHHCPWIGQCVGARNQKFFLNFVQSASVYTVYVLVTLVVFVAHDAREGTDPVVENQAGDLDPQKIVMIALSGLFALFTITLQATHVRLILTGYTTLESLQARRIKDREDLLLREADGGCLGCTTGGALRRRRKRREWDTEWGRIDKEGNIWWLGSARREWEEVMGKKKIGWILPIGRSLNDGRTYPVNPRFDEQGIWRRRAEWPAELR